LKNNSQIKSIPISIVPNPVIESASMIFTLQKKTNVSVDIMNIEGQRVMTYSKINGQMGENLLNIDCRKLSKGIYFLSLKTNEFIQTTKIIKQ
jgi:hypothetical protein